FNYCSGLTSLDLSSFNTDKVKSMFEMFSGCSGLTTIYVSDDFTTDNVSMSYDMFLRCSNLKGAASYDSNKTDHSMANYTTGYFTNGTTSIDQLNSVATDDAEYYDINGRRIDTPAKGVNIVRRDNKTIKVIIK
ncbi:MAG: BspA family leucine-rich repeat surface protein, partial [Prevotella sp.]|nr:BspA family leucine-rich repeat surface protein [Prevotella sp.]